MTTPKKVRVIASKPAPGQCGIQELIGQEFHVVRGGFDPDDGTVTVVAPSTSQLSGGCIVLQASEYEVTER